mgnify:CR=1 FL=1
MHTRLSSSPTPADVRFRYRTACAYILSPDGEKHKHKGAHLKTTRIKISNKHLTYLQRITNRQYRYKNAGNSLRHLQEGVRSRKSRQRRDFARRKALW